MRGFAPRFSTPLDAPRPRGSPMLEGFSPKLGRRVRLFNRSTFRQWVRLEVDPAVLSLCERPVRSSPAPGSRVVDFWVQRDAGEQLLLVDDEQDELAPTASDIPVQRVAAADLAAAATLIDNWQRMLPTIVSTRAWHSGALADSVQECVREPMALSRLERAFAMGDPPVVRGAVFELLRKGRLIAPSLHSQPLTPDTIFGPAS
ncbi:hypothetical protein SRS16P2_00138 (plasmid) [Variovorax sp. SRS16]|uniref:hypothetical protein n=1 Tax=Variovorax sp. SRS16 TaxID=282217 RepID=UPI0013163F7A|nr:hypothetical protein [Variovorax sp. SRS16]VTU45419.1 hypothetical protein SRS16P2_00138 [Variovorax sp. SRS16]